MKYIILAAALISTIVFPLQAFAQSDAQRLNGLEQRIAELERRPRSHAQRLNGLEQRVAGLERRPRSHEAAGGAAFVAAAVCALWAQQTGRNAWLWFFLGLFFNVITLVVLLYKNSRDKPGQLVPSG